MGAPLVLVKLQWFLAELSLRTAKPQAFKEEKVVRFLSRKKV